MMNDSCFRKEPEWESKRGSPRKRAEQMRRAVAVREKWVQGAHLPYLEVSVLEQLLMVASAAREMAGKWVMNDLHEDVGVLHLFPCFARCFEVR
ncbi:hypothetical protein DV515_00006094 [Chloebia gouldiae]|uniref:Uncharacterized protein n=1 Tax=Chloebia gouldiae TaxID=44316 RepID=A0A3L8SLG5_CHLGU|nr:hypothetical protein DV515_00006094 [Chloebia gouldiae]